MIKQGAREHDTKKKRTNNGKCTCVSRVVLSRIARSQCSSCQRCRGLHTPQKLLVMSHGLCDGLLNAKWIRPNEKVSVKAFIRPLPEGLHTYCINCKSCIVIKQRNRTSHRNVCFVSLVVFARNLFKQGKVYKAL